MPDVLFPGTRGGTVTRMRNKRIRLFMWAYQPHFRLDFETRMNGVLRELGVPDAGAECFLVGARIPDRCP